MNAESIIKCIKNNEIDRIAKGTVKDVFLLNSKEILKCPRHLILFSEQIKDKKERESYQSRYKTYLLGINQILNEIYISLKEQNNSILCPVTSYFFNKRVALSVSPKVATAGNILQDEEFDLKFFCKKVGINYDNIYYEIYKLVEKYNLSYDDLINNEGNFGIDYKNKKIVLIDYGLTNALTCSCVLALEENMRTLMSHIREAEYERYRKTKKV